MGGCSHEWEMCYVGVVYLRGGIVCMWFDDDGSWLVRGSFFGGYMVKTL